MTASRAANVVYHLIAIDFVLDIERGLPVNSRITSSLMIAARLREGRPVFHGDLGSLGFFGLGEPIAINAPERGASHMPKSKCLPDFVVRLQTYE